MKIYQKREQDSAKSLLREIERVVLLKVVDQKWMAHIDDMEQAQARYQPALLRSEEPRSRVPYGGL